MSTFIRKIKFVGAIHDRYEHTAGKITEEELEVLMIAMASQVQKATGNDAYFEIVYEKCVGTKINS